MSYNCINTSSQEFIDLLQKTKLDETILKAKIGVWQEKNKVYDSYPSLEDLLYPVTPIKIVKGYSVDEKVKEKYFRNSRIKRTSDVLKSISDSSHPLNKLAEHLLNFSSINNVNIILDNVQHYFFMDAKIKKAIGYYDYVPNIIKIAENAQVKNGNAEGVILHEILHALSYHALRADTDYTKAFRELYNYSISQLGEYNPETKEGYYGNHTIDEFFVALFTDSKFISKLQSIEPINSKKFNNLFEEIFDHILKLLKLDNNPSLYNQAFAVATNVLQYEKERTDDILDRDEAFKITIKPKIEKLFSPSPEEIKPGVQEIFDNNPELANEVYDALGFNTKLKTSLGKELEYKDPYIPKSRLKDFKQYEVLDENNNSIGTVVIEYRGDKSVILHPKLNVNGKGYGKDLYKLVSNKFNVEVQEWNEGAIANTDSAKKMWDSLEKEGSAKRIFDAEQGDNFRILNYNTQITPEQKQQALQLYSQYIDTTNNPTIQEFKEFLINKDLQNQIEETEPKPIKEGVAEVFEQTPELVLIGTAQEYSDYLDTVFPDSKVKDIVYHGSKTKYTFRDYLSDTLDYNSTTTQVWVDGIMDTDRSIVRTLSDKEKKEYRQNGRIETGEGFKLKNGEYVYYKNSQLDELYNKGRFEKFKKREHDYGGLDTFLGTGHYFTTSKEDANRGYNREGLYSAIVDIKNPYTENKGYSNSRSGKGSQELIDKGYDAVTEKISNGQEYNVFEPEQIHILGGEQDQRMFKEYMDFKNNVKDYFNLNEKEATFVQDKSNLNFNC